MVNGNIFPKPGPNCTVLYLSTVQLPPHRDESRVTSAPCSPQAMLSDPAWASQGVAVFCKHVSPLSSDTSQAGYMRREMPAAPLPTRPPPPFPPRCQLNQ